MHNRHNKYNVGDTLQIINPYQFSCFNVEEYMGKVGTVMEVMSPLFSKDTTFYLINVVLPSGESVSQYMPEYCLSLKLESEDPPNETTI